ncbi:MAG TPA: hypothetical protein VFA12_13070 [Stellaceae bacterium]|nr:hypothetical protein [Stellaceae bacterium]
MWNITLTDINRVKGQLQARRAKIEAKYIEDTKTLDEDLAELETLERVASAFALKHHSAEGFDGAAEPEPAATEPAAPAAAAPEVPEPAVAEAGNGIHGKLASRWRLHLDSRPAVEAE